MSEKRFEATLGGVAFSSLADELVLVDIDEKPIEMDTQTVLLGLRDGMHRTRNARKALKVELRYKIWTQDVVRRAEVCELVADWADKGGTLKVNYRPGRILQVQNDTPPSLGSSHNWTDTITLTLTAYAVPYWQSATAAKASIYTQTMDDGSYYIAELLHPDGNAGDIRVEGMLTHIGNAPLTHMRISCERTFFEFEGLYAEPGSVFMIAYDDGILSVVNFTQVEGDNSLLPFRTADSSDDLIAASNVDNQVKISADQRLQGQLTARGMWR